MFVSLAGAEASILQVFSAFRKLLLACVSGSRAGLIGSRVEIFDPGGIICRLAFGVYFGGARVVLYQPATAHDFLELCQPTANGRTACAMSSGFQFG